MISAVSSSDALQNRCEEKARTSGLRQWHTDFIGARVKQVEDRPQAFLVEMDAHGEIRSHFHQVNQYQVFVAGSGTLGRNVVPLIALHYVDHHTAYGPINAGPHGMTMFTLRQMSDPGGYYLHMPGYKEMLKPSKQRYLFAKEIQLSTSPVLKGRNDNSLEAIFDDYVDQKDGLGAFMLRMGADGRTTGPDPRTTGGQYYLVLNGTLQYNGR